MNQNNENRNIMHRYLNYICSPIYFLETLEDYTHGTGVQIGSTTLIFADSPDVTVYNDWPELVDFDGVGFYCDNEPSSPLLVTYQDFYDNLKKTVEKYIEGKDIKYQTQAKAYLEAIKIRYRLK